MADDEPILPQGIHGSVLFIPVTATKYSKLKVKQRDTSLEINWVNTTLVCSIS
jgi:hypothetical protein